MQNMEHNEHNKHNKGNEHDKDDEYDKCINKQFFIQPIQNLLSNYNFIRISAIEPTFTNCFGSSKISFGNNSKLMHCLEHVSDASDSAFAEAFVNYITIVLENIIPDEFIAYLPHTISVLYLDNYKSTLELIETNSHIITLIIGNYFNKIINNLPPNLKYLKIGDKFNQEIKTYSSNLKVLVLGNSYDKNLDNLPMGLIKLVLGDNFNCEINNLPSTLEYLILGAGFNKNVDFLPNSLKDIVFGFMFDKPIDNLPNSICNIVIGNNNIKNSYSVSHNYSHDINFMSNNLKSLSIITSIHCPPYKFTNELKQKYPTQLNFICR